LRVHDQERAAGVAPPVSRGPRQPDFLSARSSKLTPSSSTSLHLAKYECTVRHFGKSLGNARH
jgi:hypothetical protein